MNKIKRIAFIIIIIKISNSQTTDYYDNIFSINPGLKIAWEIGKHPGIIIGFEGSAVYTWRNLLPMVGTVIGMQYNIMVKRPAFYYEIEFGTPFFGIALGQERFFFYNRTYSRIFAGYFGYLSYRFYINEDSGELAIVGKYPLYIGQFINNRIEGQFTRVH